MTILYPVCLKETEEEKRSALGQLRGHGKHAKVGSVRVGGAKLGGPGVMQVIILYPVS